MLEINVNINSTINNRNDGIDEYWINSKIMIFLKTYVKFEDLQMILKLKF